MKDVGTSTRAATQGDETRLYVAMEVVLVAMMILGITCMLI
jgi:hypothetical protein